MPTLEWFRLVWSFFKENVIPLGGISLTYWGFFWAFVLAVIGLNGVKGVKWSSFAASYRNTQNSQLIVPKLLHFRGLPFCACLFGPCSPFSQYMVYFYRLHQNRSISHYSPNPPSPSHPTQKLKKDPSLC